MRKRSLIIKGIKNPDKIIPYILFQMKYGKVSADGERLAIKDWKTARGSQDLSTLAHIQRYEWVSGYVTGLQCLDDGCGSGYGTYYLATHGVKSIVGVDISPDAIKFAQKHYRKGNLAFEIMNSCELKFHSETFDAIVSFDVLEHVTGYEQGQFISETARVLKPGGALYIGTPNKKLSIGNNPHHYKELTKGQFEELLQEYYKNVKLLGQDIQMNGVRQKEKFYMCLSNLSYRNLIIVDEDQELCCGLLAICKNPKKWDKHD